MQKYVTFVEIKFLQNFTKNKDYRKVKDNFPYTGKYRGAAHSICNLKFNMPNEIPVVFNNGLNYDYHFIIKYERLDEITEK